MFVRDPFDIAPGASRQGPASWVALAVGVMFAMVSAFLLAMSVRVLNVASEANKTSAEQSRAAAAAEAAARLKRSDPAALERMRAQQKLQQMLRTSWSGLLDALEFASQQTDGHATVLSLVPVKTQAGAAQVGITALALSNQVMLDYVRALQKDPHVREVRLLMQQPALSGTTPVVRFQLALLWQPRPGSSASALPAASATASASQAGMSR
jgi:hypothetical protein